MKYLYVKEYETLTGNTYTHERLFNTTQKAIPEAAEDFATISMKKLRRLDIRVIEYQDTQSAEEDWDGTVIYSRTSKKAG